MYTVKKQSLTEVADALRAKVGSGEELQFPADFVSAINNIKSAPESVPEKDVNFYDYEGTRIASYTADEAAVLAELPTPPAHDGLTFQGWNYTLDEVHSHAAAADVGALYVTDDGKTRLCIDVTEPERLDIGLVYQQTVAGGTTIDWGDGSSEVLPQTSGTQIHNYAATGSYVITLDVKENCRLTLKKSCISGTLATAGLYMKELTAVEFGYRVSVEGSTFYEAKNLMSIAVRDDLAGFSNFTLSMVGIKFVTIPRSITAIPNQLLRNDYRLEHISIPPTVTTINGGVFYQCESLLRLVIPDEVTIIEARLLDTCANVRELVVGSGVTSLPFYTIYSGISAVRIIIRGDIKDIASSAFTGSRALKTLDLTHCSQVPTLSDTNALIYTPADKSILVPAALAEEWRQATNWATYADYIKGI